MKSLYIALLLLAGCGGGNDYVGQCNASCDKAQSCNLGNADTCKQQRCSQAAIDTSVAKCKNADTIFNVVQTCLSKECQDYAGCTANIPACVM